MYLLVKGCNGFANMMSVLSVAYIFARNNNLILVIDWTHPEWKLGFDKYFVIQNCNYMSYEDFKKYYKLDKNHTFSVFPSQFKNNLFEPLFMSSPELEKENKYHEVFYPVINMFNKNKNFNEKKYDIIVFSFNWIGDNHMTFLWNNLKVNDEIKNDIQIKMNLMKKYNAIHVRHTDNKNISTIWITDYLKENINKNIFLATDNEIILNICKSIHPNIFNFTNFFEKSKPLHMQELEENKKDLVNIDTIRDMYLLINSEELKITPIKTIPYMTTYSLMANSIKNK